MNLTVSQAWSKTVPVTVVAIHGALEGSNYQELINKVKELCNAGTHHLLLDLSDLSFISTAGLFAVQIIAKMLRGEKSAIPEESWAAVHSIHREVEAGLQKHLKLLNPQPRVDRVLELAGFKRYLEVFTDRDTAIASFG